MRFKLAASAFVLLIVFTGTWAAAQDKSAIGAAPAPGDAAAAGTPAGVDRLDQVEQELVSLRQRVEVYEGGGCASMTVDWREKSLTPGIYAGYEFLFIRPYFENQSAYILGHVISQQGVVGTIEETVPFGTPYQLTPRVWLGYASCSGLGARVRYWQFDHDTPSVTVGTVTGDTANTEVQGNGTLSAVGAEAQGNNFRGAVEGDALFASHSLKLDALDVDITQDFNWWNTLILLGGGIRYAKMEQDYFAAAVTGAPQFEFLFFEHNFEGVGPTVAVDLKRQLGSSGFSILGSARGSVVFGHASEIGIDADRGVEGFEFNVALSKNSDARGIGEVQLAVQYEQTVFANSSLFVRGGWEGQLWQEFGGPNFDTGDLAMQGFSLALGINR
ncbi:MAG: Lpg1974 family pore-forming outer membrane protein [Pirellulales bacterium]